MSTASLKAGVDVRGIRPELILGLQIAESIYRHHGYDFVVTSIVDGKHSAQSLHYEGLAADVRIWTVPEERRRDLVEEIATALGSQWDVVLESDHVHVEADFD